MPIPPIEIETFRFTVICAYQRSRDLAHVIYSVRNSVEMTACTFDAAERASLRRWLDSIDSPAEGSTDVSTE